MPGEALRVRFAGAVYPAWSVSGLHAGPAPVDDLVTRGDTYGVAHPAGRLGGRAGGAGARRVPGRGADATLSRSGPAADGVIQQPGR